MKRRGRPMTTGMTAGEMANEVAPASAVAAATTQEAAATAVDTTSIEIETPMFFLSVYIKFLLFVKKL
jgi:hypothetical protein